MPKRTYGQTTFKRKQPYTKKRNYTPGFKSIGYKSANYAKPPRVEKKWFDTYNTGTTLAVAGSTPIEPCLNLITQGAGESQMIGRRICVKSVEMKFDLMKEAGTNANVDGVNNQDAYRLLLVWDRQCNGAAASWLDVMENNDYYSERNLENSTRFTILKEWLGTMDQVVFADGTDYSSGRQLRAMKKFRKVNIDMEFNAEQTPGTRDITEVRTSNLLIIGASKRGTITYQGRARVRYTDS